MSDLAPFVAAAIRDKVVTELVEENNRLKRKVEQLEEQIAKKTSHTLMITAASRRSDDDDNHCVEGNDDDDSEHRPTTVVYAKAEIDDDGWEMAVDTVSRWMVDLTMEPGVSFHYSQVYE
jgi:hypothetical protein